ncbi:MAG: hypothetical protein ACR65R_07200 [Methylomicrobium sp.]
MAEKEYPEILVYRRTHTGDPNDDGVFGCHGCMKSVRDWEYDAVIGIGGTRPDRGHEAIKERITWIGIYPKKTDPTPEDLEKMKSLYPDFEFGGQLVTFEKFLLLNEDGPLVKNESPVLHKYMFEEGRIPRTAKNFSQDIHAELKKILKLADQAPPSPARDTSKKAVSLKSKCLSSAKSQKSRGCK